MTTPSAPEPRGEENQREMLRDFLAQCRDETLHRNSQYETFTAVQFQRWLNMVNADEDTIARLQREAEGLRRENQELRAAHYDATDGISGTLLKDQIEALTRERDEARRECIIKNASIEQLQKIILTERGEGV